MLIGRSLIVVRLSEYYTISEMECAVAVGVVRIVYAIKRFKRGTGTGIFFPVLWPQHQQVGHTLLHKQEWVITASQ
jgi:hypothetical protein